MQCFYIDADISRGWPSQAASSLCKFGVTSQAVPDRCLENEKYLQTKFGVEADMKAVFEAEGFITELERHIARVTEPWSSSRLEGGTEWRQCRPRQLARVAVLLTRRIASKMRHRFGGAGLDLQIIREPVPPMPRACPDRPPGGPLPLTRPRPRLHPMGA